MNIIDIYTLNLYDSHQIFKELNIRQSNISQYIKGQKMPALDTLANLCKLLDVDANYILCQE